MHFLVSGGVEVVLVATVAAVMVATAMAAALEAGSEAIVDLSDIGA